MAGEVQVRTGDIVRRRLSKALEKLGVAAPGTIVSVAANGLTATVRVGVNRRVPAQVEGDPDGFEEMAPVQNVPVMWPQGRGIYVDPLDMLQPGDTVLLVCLDRDASAWRTSGGDVSNPLDARLHDWANAVAIPGLTPTDNPFPAGSLSDGPALASKLDKLIGILTGWTPVASDGGAALKANVLLAFPTIPANATPTPETGLTTTASDRLRLDK